MYDNKNSIITCLIGMIPTLFFAMEMESIPKEIQKQIASYYIIDLDNDQLLQNFDEKNGISCNKAWSLLVYAQPKLHYEQHNRLAQRLKFIDWRNLSAEQDAVLQKMFAPRKLTLCSYVNNNLVVYFTEVHCNKTERTIIDTMPYWPLQTMLPEKEHMIVKSQFTLDKQQLLYDGIEMVDNILKCDFYSAIKKVLPHIMIMLPYSFHEHYELYKEDERLQIKKFSSFIT